MAASWRHPSTLAPQQDRVMLGLLLKAVPSGPLARVENFSGPAIYMDGPLAEKSSLHLYDCNVPEA